MQKLILAGVIGAVSLFAAPVSAQAQSCYGLSQQRAALHNRMARLVAEYPGTHAVIGMCAAGASNTYENTGDSRQASQAFVVCAGIGCLVVGFSNCVQITTQWFSIAMEADDVDKAIRRRC